MWLFCVQFGALMAWTQYLCLFFIFNFWGNYMITRYFSKFNKVFVGLSALALVFVASPSLMAADEDADVEEVVVTGSRIKRDTINSASVVTTITSEDIEQSQALLTADILRLSTYNTFGSFGQNAKNGQNRFLGSFWPKC